MGKYAVELEVSAPLAMFARADSGTSATSFPAPTWSAAKGILESIAYLKSGAAFSPTRVELCRRVGAKGGKLNFQRYATNYGGPLRKSNQAATGAGLQIFATVLSDVCYRIYADVVSDHGAGGSNAAHHLKDLFERRLVQGRCHQTPALGWKEFTCSYWGVFRHELYEVDDELTFTIPSMLTNIWDAPQSGRWAPRFRQNVQIVRGILSYAE